MKRINNTIIVLLITLVFSFLISTYGKTETDESSAAAEAELYIVGDAALDAFIGIYAKDVLHSSDYQLTTENREKIRGLLSAMGTANIMLLNKAVLAGSPVGTEKEVLRFAENNFMWEEELLMKKYILSDDR